MKENYTSPEIVIVAFDSEDVITESPTINPETREY